jgi:hypothetical protein
MRTSAVERYSPAGAERFLRHRQSQTESLFRRLGFKHVPRHHNPNIGGIVEVITQPQYDSVAFAQAAAFTKTTLFQNTIGQASKTLCQTNMTQPGQLPNPQRLTVHAICVHVSNNTIPADMFNILQNVSLTFTVNTKPYFQGPVLTLPAGRGYKVDAASLSTAALAGGSLFSASNGGTDPRATYILAAPITIEQGEQFQVILNPETAFNFTATATQPVGVGATITVFLDGDLERGVS